MDYSNEKAPEPEIKKSLKEYTFTRILENDNIITPEGNNNKDLKEEKEEKDKVNLNLSISMILYEGEIEFNVKGTKDNCKVPNVQYVKLFPFEELKNLNKFFTMLQIDKIFDVLQKSFEKQYDVITQGEEELKIKLMINIMDVMTEEISFDLPIIILSSKDELESLKETIKMMEEEKNSFKKMITKLNTTVQELQKKMEENKNLSLNKEKEIETKINEKEKELIKNIKEKDNLHQSKEKELQTKIDDKEKELIKNIEVKDNLHQSKEMELQTKIEEKEEELRTKIGENINGLKLQFKNELEEKERRLLNYIENLNSQMKEVKEVEKYVRDTLMDKENKEEEEEDEYTCTRNINVKQGTLNLSLSMILLEARIKFIIKEIQDNLMNNPKYYETSFAIKNFDKIGTYYMENGGIKALFTFLCDLLKNGKDTILMKEDKIIVTVKFPLGAKDEEISLSILQKKKSLQKTLNDIDLTLKDLNKANLYNEDNLEETKKEFKKMLLEKVYPIGSYYWSEKNIDPGSLFGGTWTKIYGRFLFASDSSHSVGYTGGQERVTLSSYEIPSHSHTYYRCQYDSYKRCTNADVDSNGNYKVACYNNDKSNDYSTSTSSFGGNSSHENMPPYLTANCWRRIG